MNKIFFTVLIIVTILVAHKMYQEHNSTENTNSSAAVFEETEEYTYDTEAEQDENNDFEENSEEYFE